jgi:hypothetical protein
MTLERKEPSLFLSTHTAVDVLFYPLHPVMGEQQVGAQQHVLEEHHPDLLQNLSKLGHYIVHCHTLLITGMIFVPKNEQAFKYTC